LILTDLEPAGAHVAWYGLRSWIECGFKDSKRRGWHWEQTKMKDPRRAERLWLAIAVATLWTVSVGCQAEATLAVPLLSDLPEQHIARRRVRQKRPSRALSCFRRGRLLIVAALCAGQAVPQGRLLPEPWPKSLDSHTEHPSVQAPLRKAA
jgi:DDE family transposase